MKIEELKGGIKNIREPRRTGYGNIRHKLEDIIIIGLCTVYAEGKTMPIWRRLAEAAKSI